MFRTVVPIVLLAACEERREGIEGYYVIEEIDSSDCPFVEVGDEVALTPFLDSVDLLAGWRDHPSDFFCDPTGDGEYDCQGSTMVEPYDRAARVDVRVVGDVLELQYEEESWAVPSTADRPYGGSGAVSTDRDPVPYCTFTATALWERPVPPAPPDTYSGCVLCM